jgi:hypothetical protein
MCASTACGGYYHAPAPGLGDVSPFYGLFDLTFHITHPRHYEPTLAWSAGWSVVLAGIAAVLLLATLALFDRRLGRLAESTPVAGRDMA